MRLLATTILGFLISSTVSAAASVTVLGLPLGGKLPQEMRACTKKEADGAAKALCWTSPPMSLSKGAKSGFAELPNRDHLPKWAAYGTFKAVVAKDSTLHSIQVETRAAYEAGLIVDSISSRFGPPRELKDGQIKSAKWIRPDIYIELLCSPDFCTTDFMSAASYKEWQDGVKARDKKDAARPIAP